MITATRRIAPGVMLAAGLAAWAQAASAQTPSSHITIPFLANDTKPGDLEFEGAECDVEAGASRMTCVFQQVFLTTSPIVPDTCLITTNRYQRVFRLDSPSHWTSREAPAGVCGVQDVAMLQDDGGVRWTMELTKDVTRRDASAACRAMEVQREVFSWRNVRRTLPCKSVQPGGLMP